MKLFSVAALLALAAPVAAQGACPISGIAKVDFGIGTGFMQPSYLDLQWSAASCGLTWTVDAPTCCNVYVPQHFMVVGNQILTNPTVLPNPLFLVGSLSYTNVLAFLGPYAGTQGALPVPPTPALIGIPFTAQAVPEFFTTIGFSTDYGVSQAVAFTFG